MNVKLVFVVGVVAVLMIACSKDITKPMSFNGSYYSMDKSQEADYPATDENGATIDSTKVKPSNSTGDE